MDPTSDLGGFPSPIAGEGKGRSPLSPLNETMAHLGSGKKEPHLMATKGKTRGIYTKLFFLLGLKD